MKIRSSTSGSNRASATGEWDQVDVARLKPAARRIRTHSAGKKRSLEASIRELGLLDPITINCADVIVDGHLRVEIARKLGFRTVPVIRISHLSDAELSTYALAANKLPGVANYDLEALRVELEEIRAELPSLDLTLTGFSAGELDRIGGRHAATRYDDLDEIVPPAANATSSITSGSLFALGAHRLICGDSLDPRVIARLMGGEAASCCFTDPPYNVKINGHVSSTGRHAEFAMATGEMTRAEFETFLATALTNTADALVEGALAFICMDHAHMLELLQAGNAVFDRQLNICVWDKGRGGMGAPWRGQHEMVVVFKKGDAPHLDNIQLGRHGRNRTNIWSFPGVTGFGRGKRALELHPTVKPVALVAEALLDVTAPGQIVLDPFGGSGSTLIAAERIDRRARLAEYDPVYVDRIIARWEKLTGNKAELLFDPAATTADDLMEGEG